MKKYIKLLYCTLILFTFICIVGCYSKNKLGYGEFYPAEEYQLDGFKTFKLVLKEISEEEYLAADGVNVVKKDYVIDEYFSFELYIYSDLKEEYVLIKLEGFKASSPGFLYDAITTDKDENFGISRVSLNTAIKEFGIRQDLDSSIDPDEGTHRYLVHRYLLVQKKDKSEEPITIK